MHLASLCRFLPLLLLCGCPNGNVGDDDASAGDDDSTADSAVTLVINEFMASNTSTIEDETGAYPDWVEIWNSGTATVDLGGFSLTDDLTNPTKWTFASGTTLAAGDWLLVWCDGDTADGSLHAAFKLSGAGEQLGLYGALEDGAPPIDELDYGAQAADVSSARMPDGGDWDPDASPTPGSANQ